MFTISDFCVCTCNLADWCSNSDIEGRRVYLSPSVNIHGELQYEGEVENVSFSDIL